MKKLIFLLISIGFLIPGYSFAATQNIHIEWTYDYPPVEDSILAGYYFYKEGVKVCTSNSSTSRAMDCSFESEPGTFAFTQTAFFSDGYESPHSAPYILTLNSLSEPTIEDTSPLPTIEDTSPIDVTNTIIATQGTPVLQMELGELEIDNNWVRVEFSSQFINPVVVVGPPSTNGTAPCVTRLKNITSTGFDIRIQEWNYLDGNHTKETVSYLVMEQGSFTLDDGTMVKAGRFNSNDTAFQTVQFDTAFTVAPVVMTSIATFNEEDTVTGRLYNISTTSFEHKTQEQQSGNTHGNETVNYIAWEPSQNSIGDISVIVGKTQDEVTDRWHTVDYGKQFINLPIFFGTMQSYDGSDTSSIRYENKTYSEIQVKVEEEQSADDETTHTSETVGFFLFSQSTDNESVNQVPAPQIELGELEIDNNWVRVEFSSQFINPVVVVGPPSTNGTAPCVTRLKNITSTGFDIRIQEWNYLDGNHTKETVSYLVMEQGSFTLDDGTMVKAGRFNSNDTAFQTVQFDTAFTVAPVVMTSIATFNEEDTVTGRLYNISTTSFEHKTQEQQSGNTHGNETVNYIAWEPSQNSIGDISVIVGKTQDEVTDRWHTVDYGKQFINLPIFFGTMQSYDGSDTSSIRYENKTYSEIQVKVEEEQSADDETTHTSETVGFFLFSQSTANK